MSRIFPWEIVSDPFNPGGVVLKDLRWRTILVGLVLVASIVFLLPTINPSIAQKWKKVMPAEKIHLGLDLQGGMHLILEVEAEKAVSSYVNRLAEDLKDTLRKQRIAFRSVERQGDAQILLNLTDPAQQGEIKKILDKDFPTIEMQAGETRQDGVLVPLALRDQQAQSFRKQAVAQALETIRNRIDQFGVSEPDIRPEGEERILIQLPGIKDPQRAIDLIGKTAQLEFKLVAEDVAPRDAKDGKTPAGTKVYPMSHLDPATGRSSTEEIVLKDRTLMTGEAITNAQVQIDHQYNTPYVSLEFDSNGARHFERITEENIKKRLAIVLDGTVYSAPVIQDKISGGKASITGSFTMDEARDLAIVLRAGALPAPVKILEQRTVGPSLGQDSINKGFVACVVGLVGIMIFMGIYYKFSGLIATLALLLNIPLILAVLAIFKATLTLPGIAGMILTVGMAVDSCVLIFERIREELRLGKTPRASVETGYTRATLTIMDSNVTTLIAAVVLFQFGTGPVRGFAVTLTIGILVSLFTAIIVTRIIFDFLLARQRMRTLSI
jgi:preprotein translocase subunit SecD